ncbi:corrinoid ABC transporter substrate-binding protein [Streptomyces sp. YIM 130001]|uniref:ABC transporter substrate-binding protein n=1 Tax=Streptomyces sp. YIM 130001 TaxID=2259644 RepID=UPI000ECB6470|nr:ABC transporter substrate-binding protein [Streptomyces sp. YIM 130001]RII08068.1 corrinoid ABC transporter substrate-binding protein [Streptomyces sp. YIM 130001]
MPSAPASRRAPLRFSRPALAGVVCALLLTACGQDDGGGGGQGAKSAPDGFPVVLENNCGEKVTVEAPPKRAVALDQGSAEIMLSLGLGDRMAGTGTWTDPVMKGLEKENAKVERLADQYPSAEKVLDVEPDFVAASFAATLSKGGVAPRGQFAELGVPSYLSPTDCVGKDNSGDGDGARTKTLTMKPVYDEVRDLARVFGVRERGEQLVKDLESRVDKATEGLDASKAGLLYWFANSDAPYLAGCCGAPGVITRELGAENVFDDTRDEWPQINWETVAERDPDVLVIGDLTRKSQTAESAKRKIAFLESHPVTKKLRAVRDERYVLLSGQAMNPTIRTVEGIEQVAAKLREFGLAK